MQMSCVAYGIALFGMQWRAWACVKNFSLKEGKDITKNMAITEDFLGKQSIYYC